MTATGGMARVVRTSHVEVELIHRNHLRIPTARRPALDPKRGTLRRLPQTRNRWAPERGPQRLRKTHRRGALAFAEGGGRDARDDNVTAVGAFAETLAHIVAHLGHVLAVWDKLSREDTDLGSKIHHGFGNLRAGNLHVTGYRPRAKRRQLFSYEIM